jgi:twinkle protein
MGTSNLTFIEERAKALDEERRLRMIKSQDIDVEKYLKSNDITHQVHEPDHWLQEMVNQFDQPERKEALGYLCWGKTSDDFQYRLSEVTIYAGTNGGGKSLVTGQIALGLIKQNKKVCIASFEMKPMQTLNRMLRQFSGINFDNPYKKVSKTEFQNIANRFLDFSHEKLWLYDQQGTTNAQQVIAMTRYVAVELGVTHVFIDSLMKCVAAEDAYNDQKYFIDELCAVARDHNIHIHLVHHIRKLGSEENMPSKTDIKGTGAITDQVDNVFLVYRNKKKEHDIQAGKLISDDVPDMYLMCEKQRNGEFEGWISLWYNGESQQFVERFGSPPMAFDQSGEF